MTQIKALIDALIKAETKSMAVTRRGARSDGTVTQNRIVESAGSLIRRDGFARTTSKAIAQEAEVDLASINYHFGSREGLYQAVLAQAHRQLIDLDELRVIAASPRAPVEQLAALIELMARRATGPDRWGPAVLAREILDPTWQLAELFASEVSPKIAVVLGILSAITGIPADAPELLCCLVSVGAPCAMLLLVRDGASPIREGIARLSPDELASHLHRFAVAGLEAAARDYAARQPA